jgi:hypothetical protein
MILLLAAPAAAGAHDASLQRAAFALPRPEPPLRDVVRHSGDANPAPDSASREFVLAHEYGHHVAQHRAMPSPFPAAINWGTERWSSVENVCQGHRSGDFFPGDEGRNYYETRGRPSPSPLPSTASPARR